MMPLKLSCALILSVLVLGISTASPLPLGSEHPSVELKSSLTLPETSATSTPTEASDNPSPGEGELRQPEQYKPTDNEGNRGAEQHSEEKTPPLSNTKVHAEEHHDSSQTGKDKRYDHAAIVNAIKQSNVDLTRYTRYLAIFTFVLAVVAAVQVGVFAWQLWLFRGSLSHTKKAANAAEKNADAVKMAERAYVTMSHKPPGFVFRENETTRWVEVTMRVENCGRTPALITDIRLTAHRRDEDGKLPKTPTYRSNDENGHGQPWLTPGAFIDWGPRTFRINLFKVNEPPQASPEWDAIGLCVFGYVEYIDIFGDTHCAGYGREFRDFKDNNLFLVPDIDRSYNYDRKKGEGCPGDPPPTT